MALACYTHTLSLTRTHTHTHTHAHSHTHTHAHTPVHPRTQMHTYTRILTHTHTRTHTHLYIHVHKCTHTHAGTDRPEARWTMTEHLKDKILSWLRLISFTGVRGASRTALRISLNLLVLRPQPCISFLVLLNSPVHFVIRQVSTRHGVGQPPTKKQTNKNSKQQQLVS